MSRHLRQEANLNFVSGYYQVVSVLHLTNTTELNIGLTGVQNSGEPADIM